MFSHIMVGSNDIDRSKSFYDALFAARGGTPGIVDPKGRLIYMHNDNLFMVTRPIDGNAATHANGGTIGFTVANPERPTLGTRRASALAEHPWKTRRASATWAR